MNGGTLATYAHLLHPVTLSQLVADWLKEDAPSFDYGGFVVGEVQEKAVLLCKSAGVLAGVPFIDAVFRQLECEVTWLHSDGASLQPVCPVAYVTGKVRHLLLGERIALNCLSRASGIATYAHQLSTLARDSGWHGEVAGTRKTTPGFRLVEKYALLVGGASTHRYDLSSMVMLKDNHIWTAGNVGQAVQKARTVCGFSMKIEVECRSSNEALEAVSAGADVVMLDNFEPQVLHAVARQIKAAHSNVLIEASGGITEHNIIQFLGPDIDVVSLSRLTQGYDTVDFSFKICKDGHDPSNPTVAMSSVIAMSSVS